MENHQLWQNQLLLLARGRVLTLLWKRISSQSLHCLWRFENSSWIVSTQLCNALNFPQRFVVYETDIIYSTPRKVITNFVNKLSPTFIWAQFSIGSSFAGLCNKFSSNCAQARDKFCYVFCVQSIWIYFSASRSHLKHKSFRGAGLHSWWQSGMATTQLQKHYSRWEMLRWMLRMRYRCNMTTNNIGSIKQPVGKSSIFAGVYICNWQLVWWTGLRFFFVGGILSFGRQNM